MPPKKKGQQKGKPKSRKENDVDDALLEIAIRRVEAARALLPEQSIQAAKHRDPTNEIRAKKKTQAPRHVQHRL